jgi:hypothetical protein
MSYFAGKLKAGTIALVDFRRKTVGVDIDQSTVFLMKKTGNGRVMATAEGYGAKTRYGNGALYITSMDGVEFITPVCLLKSPTLDEYRHLQGWQED